MQVSFAPVNRTIPFASAALCYNEAQEAQINVIACAHGGDTQQPWEPPAKGTILARPNHQFEKRQRELAKQKKKEEKRQRRLERKAGKTEEKAPIAPDAEESEEAAE